MRVMKRTVSPTVNLPFATPCRSVNIQCASQFAEDDKIPGRRRKQGCCRSEGRAGGGGGGGHPGAHAQPGSHSKEDYHGLYDIKSIQTGQQLVLDLHAGPRGLRTQSWRRC